MATNLFPSRTAQSPQGQPVQEMDVDSLLLDASNPRLEIPADESQDRIAKHLFQEHRLEELMTSFLVNGYFSEEPLVAIPSATRKNFFVVVEGNRRLAALKLLLNPSLAQRIGAKGIPTASEAQLERLKRVPVKVYDTREDVLPYLGFRHITGVKEWDAASKARYTFQLKETTDYSLAEIAEMIGDTYNMTERLYLGWSLIKQAEDKLGMTRDDFVKFPFSYMYDAVRMPEIKTFLGLKADAYKVSAPNLERLQELIHWLFGSSSHQRQPVVERKDQLKMLGAVVSDKKATNAIRSGATLDEAFQESIGEANMLLEWLTKASRELDRAKGVIHRHKKSRDVRDLVMRCYETAERLDRETRQ